MDALSVAASIIGLLAATGKMAQLLKQLTAFADAPGSARTDYLNGATGVPADRGQLIQLEHLVATLVGCVTTYSELEVIIDNDDIDPKMGAFDRIKWAIKEREIQDIVQRIQNHKSSLALMLAILQCKSNQEAKNSMTKLCDLVEHVVRGNEDLSAHLLRLEGSQILPNAGNSSRVLDDDGSTTRSATSNRTGQILLRGNPATIPSLLKISVPPLTVVSNQLCPANCGYLSGRPDEIYVRRRVTFGDSPTEVLEEDFITEIHEMKSMVHQHIISLWASYTYQEHGYVLIKPATNISLKNFIRSLPQQFRAFPEQRQRRTLLNWLHCLADALAFLHQHGLTYGDIKPSNIAIDESNNIIFANLPGKAVASADRPSSLLAYPPAAPLATIHFYRQQTRQGKVTFVMPKTLAGKLEIE